MELFWQTALPPLMLALAICTDTFTACLAFGTSRVRAPAASLVVVSAVGAASLCLSLVAGRFGGGIIDPDLARILSAVLLAGTGLFKCMESAIKSLLRNLKPCSARFSLFSNLHFILTVYADPRRADEDESRNLDPREAFFLSLALSADSLAAGFSGGLAQADLLLSGVFAFGFGLLASGLGLALGHRLAGRLQWDLSWLSGALLLILAVARLFAG